MADISDLESQINMLKFQLSVGGNRSDADANALRQQIADLQKQLMVEKIRQGGNT